MRLNVFYAKNSRLRYSYFITYNKEVFVKKVKRTALFIFGSLLCFSLGKLNILGNAYAQEQEIKLNQELCNFNKDASKKDCDTKGKQTTIKSSSKLKGTQPTTICIK